MHSLRTVNLPGLPSAWVIIDLQRATARLALKRIREILFANLLCAQGRVSDLARRKIRNTGLRSNRLIGLSVDEHRRMEQPLR